MEAGLVAQQVCWGWDTVEEWRAEFSAKRHARGGKVVGVRSHVGLAEEGGV